MYDEHEQDSEEYDWLTIFLVICYILFVAVVLVKVLT